MLKLLLLLFTLSSLNSQHTSFIDNPPSFYQRGRESEYSKHSNFYQWWYFNLRHTRHNNLSTGTDFALDYSYLKSSTNDIISNNSGAYVLFSQFDVSRNQQNMQVYEKWPLNEFTIDNYFDVSIADEFSIRVINEDTIHLRGHMSHRHNKTWAYEHIDPQHYTIEWDFRMQRIHGWFGQALEETVLADQGVIGWNTYGYVSQLADDHGWIRITDHRGKDQKQHQLYKLKRSDYQVYADMNYGSTFPSSSSLVPVAQDIDYPWTWMLAYYQDHTVDEFITVSIVAGIGRQDMGATSCGASDGAYINVWINRTVNGVATSQVSSLGYSQILACNKTLTLLKQSNDGGSNFTIQQKLSNWQHRTDKFGTHLIPLEHALYIQSPHRSITMTCYATTNDYLRFLFPLSTFIFSDFEAIGVPCHVVIKEKDNALIDFWSTSTGVEFGYRAII